ncbi:uncharacterized protein J3D65DRAFT_406363 [Phyllosticta citribraziliensis]|uniref:G-patch domain-containing protein n=1 Tax=Phyllosticta citribraziliensis TaxID=989973 RepID=A0ABR1LQ72_9PEZI
MSYYKRSRATFEADLQSHESPYALFGTPLPPLDENTRDDGSYVPLWKQEVTDERGRKRLHGAFTGGFSAGYFNTVGSKEGWKPATFVSSRTNRHKDQKNPQQQRPEDYMDDEDLADAEEARKIETAGDFAGLGSTGDDLSKRDALLGLVKTTGETMGVKLLQKMGWKMGQGVGPKVRRKARLDPDDAAHADSDQQTHLFAPEHSPMITFVRKNDHKGLGYEGEARLSNVDAAGKNKDDEDDEDNSSNGSLKTKPKAPKAAKRGGFGVGILNDTGSDEEDPYEMGPKISYNRVLGGDKKPKKKVKPSGASANPLLGTKPVFISKKTQSKKTDGFRKCHDGRLPLDGFVLATQSLSLSDDGKYAPPQPPPGWSSSKSSTSASEDAPYQSTADAAKASTLDAKSRAAILGEQALPGKSVFDFLSPAARERIAAATGKNNLPAARGEFFEGSQQTDAEKRKTLWNLVPALDASIAAAALNRGTSGWMPYAEDAQKRARYRAFLELKAGQADALPERPAGVTVDEWVRELNEFAQAANVFKPISGLMAARFVSSSSQPASSSGESTKEKDHLLSKPATPPVDPAEQAARLGMYGPLTRQVKPFFPTRLVCKRFNVKPPSNVQPDQSTQQQKHSDAATSSAAVPRDLTIIPDSAIHDMLRDAPAAFRTAQTAKSAAAPVGEEASPAGAVGLPTHAPVDVEKNEALEAQRAGDEVFKAIFGSDDEDEDE